MYLDRSIEAVRDFDPEMANITDQEETRQINTLNLIASENYTSPIAAGLEGSVWTDKNAEGYPGNRYAGGCDLADAVERLAIERCKQIFGCEHVNVQGMSSTVANVAVLRALLEPGDTILSMELNHGGHLSHGARFHYSGKLYQAVYYGLDPETERIDMEEVARLAKEHKPRLIICGASSYPRIIDYARFGQIAREVGAYLLADIAHPVGLVVAGLIPSPVPHADVVTSSTHKTWRGPRGGSVVMCKKELGKKIDQQLFPGLQGAPKMDIIAARAVHMKESMTEEFRDYQRAVLENTQALADELIKGGLRLVTGGSDLHLILVDVRELIPNGLEAERVLASVGIVVNRNMIPFDPLSAKHTSGIRIGSPALTTRGFDADAFRTVGRLLADTLKSWETPEALAQIRAEVAKMARCYPIFAKKWLAKV